MPERTLTPMLGILQDKGHSVALVTDGRMSGASGKARSYSPVPEAAGGGLLAKVADGDILRIDAVSGELKFMGDLAELEARDPAPQPDVGQRLWPRILCG